MEEKYRRNHPDEEWIKSKMLNKSGSYSWDSYFSPARIGYIHGVSKIKIFGYNIQLYFKWLRRKINEAFRGLR